MHCHASSSFMHTHAPVAGSEAVFVLSSCLTRACDVFCVGREQHSVGGIALCLWASGPCVKAHVVWSDEAIHSDRCRALHKHCLQGHIMRYGWGCCQGVLLKDAAV